MGRPFQLSLAASPSYSLFHAPFMSLGTKNHQTREIHARLRPGNVMAASEIKPWCMIIGPRITALVFL